MAQTATELANLALLDIGQSPIDSIDESTHTAETCKLLYAQARDTVLAAALWFCAKRRSSLALLTETPAFGFTNAYQLPSDFLRLWDINGRNKDYDLDGDRLLIDDDDAQLIYIWKLTDVSKMHPWLVEAIRKKMAAELAKALTGDRNRRVELLNELQEVFETAASVNALMLPGGDTLYGSDWLDARE